jgi:hypothetical protein
MFFRALFESNMAHPQNIISLMAKCDSYREALEAPDWKRQIDTIVQYDSNYLMNQIQH